MPVYVGARDLSGLPFGTHQFLVLSGASLTVPRIIGLRPVQARPLGGDTYGIVVGAQNRGRLVVEFFEPGDYAAAQEYFGGVSTSWYRSDYDAELVPATFGSTSDPLALDRVIACIDAYILNQELDPIRYPTAGFGTNSNSWAQSVIEYAGGSVSENFRGVDISHERRIPRTYFLPFCPASRRPKVN